MIYYVLLYLICCTVFFVGLVRYMIGGTDQEILWAAFLSFTPVINLACILLVIIELAYILLGILFEFIISSEILNKARFIRKPK